MKFLLDTSTLVRVLRRGGNRTIAARLRQTQPGDAAIASSVRLELLHGAYRQQNAAAAVVALESYLEGFPSIPLDHAVAARGAKLRVHLAAAGTPIGPYDLLIAATVLAHDLTVVAYNTGEFRRVPGLKVEDWERG